ncbi:hypothetical protein YC2023_040707 [Brassica napus]
MGRVLMVRAMPLIDVELTELGRSGDQHSSSVCYGSRALSMKLGEVNYFNQ